MNIPVKYIGLDYDMPIKVWTNVGIEELNNLKAIFGKDWQYYAHQREVLKSKEVFNYYLRKEVF